jgi:hypothetical protein
MDGEDAFGPWSAIALRLRRCTRGRRAINSYRQVSWHTASHVGLAMQLRQLLTSRTVQKAPPSTVRRPRLQHQSKSSLLAPISDTGTLRSLADNSERVWLTARWVVQSCSGRHMAAIAHGPSINSLAQSLMIRMSRTRKTLTIYRDSHNFAYLAEEIC